MQQQPMVGGSAWCELLARDHFPLQIKQASGHSAQLAQDSQGKKPPPAAGAGRAVDAAEKVYRQTKSEDPRRAVPEVRRQRLQDSVCWNPQISDGAGDGNRTRNQQLGRL
jgi:hypothetical protein